MILCIQCTDSVGLVAAIAKVLATARLNIVSMREHVDTASNRFFARIEPDGRVENPALLVRHLKEVLPADAIVLTSSLQPKQIAVLVTKEYHCLGDILIRQHFDTLGAKVACVIGNHNVLADVCKRFDIPFHLVSHEGQSKQNFENQLETILAGYPFHYLVLAKFMRILSPEFVDRYLHRIINIHHSFLPAFVGANPYRQAFERGVKLIGATAHFVTHALDEGPIIAQQIIPVNHGFTAADMVKAGKEIEKAVLAKALQLVLDERVLVHGNKTVVFE
jgi:formyltetrahydrofolate deformylase